MEMTRSDIQFTSIQIAEMAGKNHNYILKAIRKMDSATISNVGIFAQREYKNSRGQKFPIYIMDKWATLFIASKFNDELRADIINRIKELESKTKIDIPSELVDMFVPKDGYMKENPKGMLKTKPIRGYWRVDKNTEENKLLQRRYELSKIANGLIDVSEEIIALDAKIDML